ncbi:hypothetical protein ONZ45_g13944 [Pleurotus djamor]|nr:hypothetical protein ONZ45_g13944 [Pleurotus djamor]
MSLSEDIQLKYAAMYPSGTVSFDNGGVLRQICLSTNRMVSFDVVHEAQTMANSKARPTPTEAAEFLANLPSSRRVCDGCVKSGRSCVLADGRARCELCLSQAQGCSIGDRYRIDVIRRGHGLSWAEATEVYKPFVTRRTDLDNPAWRNIDGDSSTGIASVAAATSSSSRRSSSRSATTTPHAPTLLLVFLVLPPSVLVRLTAQSLRLRMSISLAVLGLCLPPSPVVEIPLPPSKRPTSSSSSSKGKSAESLVDRVDFLQSEVGRLAGVIEDWKERAEVAESEAAAFREEGVIKSQLLVREQARTASLREELESLRTLLHQEQEASEREAGEVVLVQELSRVAAELEPSGVPLPTLAMWVMRTSAGLSALQRFLGTATVPEAAHEPVSLGRRIYKASLSLLERQKSGLENWLISHLPAMENLVAGTVHLPTLEVTEERLRRIEEAARVTREGLEADRRASEADQAAEQERLAREAERLARVEAVRLQLAERQREAAELEAKLTALEDPNSQPSPPLQGPLPPSSSSSSAVTFGPAPLLEPSVGVSGSGDE